jgi:hypothetical protein
VKLGFSTIKGIDSEKKFYEVQDRLGKIAKEVGVPRILFDDVWVNAEKDSSSSSTR